MKARTIATVLLLVFVAASVGYLVIAGMQPGEGSVNSSGIDVDSSSGHKVIVYYFHGTSRCVACRKIEDYTYDAIASGFPDAMKSRLIEWYTVDVDKPENNHFIEDYQLFSQSVVIVDVVDGQQKRWENLELVWHMVDNKETFTTYIQDAVQAYLEGK